MLIPNPLQPLHEQAGGTLIPYGPQGDGEPQAQIVDTFGQYEAEYAVIRKGVGLMDLPQRGLVEVTGNDRLDFLHRVLTHDTQSLGPGQGRRAFLLTKKGRIAADLIVLHGSEQTYLELDAYQASWLVEELDRYLFSEDVRLRDASHAHRHLALHGPEAVSLLAKISAGLAVDLEPLGHQPIHIAGHACIVFRFDDTGSLGIHLLVPDCGVVAVYEHLTAALAGEGLEAADKSSAPRRGRPIGWAAYNTARIEAGVPLYHIDYGPDSLPHETGILGQAVSFTKGCYLGQEIVARMQNLGHPKRILVGLRFQDNRLPIAGSQVFDLATDSTGGPGGAGPVASDSGEVIGAITSSTLSPMLGGLAVSFAVLRWGKHQIGTRVMVPAEGRMAPAKVSPLSFLEKQAAASTH